MGLPKGRTNNPSGRKKNVPNKIGRTVKERIKLFVEAKLLELPQLWEKLSPREKSQLLTNLIPYLEAKLQAIALDAKVDMGNVTPEQLDYIIEQLTNINTKKDEKIEIV